MIREKKIGLFKIEDIWFDNHAYLESRNGITILHSNDILDENTYDLVINDKTILVDLKRTEEEIFKSFDYKSARYRINRATRDGVQVIKIMNDNDLKQYLDFQQDFCEKKEIPIVSYEDLKKMECYSAILEVGEYLGGCSFLISKDGKTARYKFGATKHKFSANEAILWYAMKDLKNRGVEKFDMGGIVITEDKSSYYYRHYQFKSKFGGSVIDSFTYVRAKGIYKPMVKLLKTIIKIFYKENTNEFILKLHHCGFL